MNVLLMKENTPEFVTRKFQWKIVFLAYEISRCINEQVRLMMNN